jgi:outer membrane protein assembly factor BamB
MGRGKRLVTVTTCVGALSVLSVFAICPAASAAASCATPAGDWPSFHCSPLNQGFAPDSTVTTANASTLGVRWATNLYGAALDSPVVAYNATLKKKLAYIGTEKGYVEAIDIATGQIVWGASLGSPIRTTPVVSDGAVYVGTFDSPTIYSLNATTGTVNCSVPAPQPIEGSPVIATPPGGVPTLYIGTNDSETASGPVLAINASTCAVEWSFTDYLQRTGVWTPMAYTLDASGTPLIVFGTADPDSTEYAVNALTGARAWTYSVSNPGSGTFDIGAGTTISPPGNNGFADGVAYVPTKAGVMYALNLTTGAFIWDTNFNSLANVSGPGRSTAALGGTDLVFGYNQGVFDLDATTGAVKWQYQDPSKQEVLSSPAVLGPSGSEIVVAADLSGAIEVLSLASSSPPNPTPLYRYQTGGYITASPAVSGGDLLVASSDGFLYDFAAGVETKQRCPRPRSRRPPTGASFPTPMAPSRSAAPRRTAWASPA